MVHENANGHPGQRERGRMVLRLLSTICLAAFLSTGATAQSEDVGTVSTYSHSITMDGQLRGCAIEFKTIARDNGRKRGLVLVTGNFSLMTVGEGDTEVVLVTRLYDAVGHAPNIKLAKVRPATSSLVGSDGLSNQTSLVEATPTGDDNLELLSVFKPDSTVEGILSRIRDSNGMELLINRTRGDIDLSVPIDLSKNESSKGPVNLTKTKDDFVACTRLFATAINKPHK
jgi:hypothetical protein